MLFNSFGFLLFFPFIGLFYFLIPSKFRILFLLIASYFFYMNWKPVYALLILTSTLITYGCGISIARSRLHQRKKVLLVVSLILNFGILFFYKYFNFIGESITYIFGTLNIGMTIPNFDLLLPVGISFYTFQAVGYSIDVYRGDIVAEKSFLKYALFVSFFPQLVAGPIERAKNLLPQFDKTFSFEYNRVVEGMKLILWGYFMKIVVADRLSVYVDTVFNNVAYHSGITLLFATILFSFQIYCDFAGYSNIAIGTAKVLGFNLMTNFKRPYFSTSITDFWRRWHISLSTWFKDYLYIPLGGNRVSKKRVYFNLLTTFVISGLWHGANWTFVIWGALHGIYQIIEKFIFKKKSIRKSKSIVENIFRKFITFALVCFTWIFFRANNVTDAFIVVNSIFTKKGSLFLNNIDSITLGVMGIITLLSFEYLHEKNDGNFVLLKNNNILIRWAAYIMLVFTLLLFGVFDGGQFIYFQF
jgi:alginate O-acetyltransferase complex protein AlgI